MSVPTLEQVKALVDAANPTSKRMLSSENPWMVIGKAEGMMLEARVSSCREALRWLEFLLKTADELESLAHPPWFSIKHNLHPLYRQVARDTRALQTLVNDFTDPDKYLTQLLGENKSYSIPQVVFVAHTMLSRLEAGYAH